MLFSRRLFLFFLGILMLFSRHLFQFFLGILMLFSRHLFLFFPRDSDAFFPAFIPAFS